MKRRMFFSAAIALVVATQRSVAQPAARKVRIGFLGSSTPDPLTLRSQVDPLRQGLRELGWTEGQNLAPIDDIVGREKSRYTRRGVGRDHSILAIHDPH